MQAIDKDRDKLWIERRPAVSLYKVIAERPLLLMLAVAFALRALATIYFSGAIDPEGAEYARIAENLLLGNGYVGMGQPQGVHLIFPPLFPFAIAAVSLLTGDVEIAGRLLSVTLGALIVLPTYIIASKMYGRQTAAVAAALVACHPFLIYMSTTVHCEMSYLILILSAICFALLATENPTLRNHFYSGGMYGLAYLVRPDAAAYMLISAALVFVSIFVRQCAGVFFTFARVSLMIGTFALVAAPYVAWLSKETGQFRIEGKSPGNIEVERRLQLGESVTDALFAVNTLGEERGVGNQANLVIIQAHSPNFKEVWADIGLKTKSVVKNASEMLAGFFGFGSPPLFALAFVGLFARPWSRYLAICQLQILGALSLMIFGTYFIFHTDPRFYVLLVPFYCIWASAGLRKLALWGMVTGSSMGFPRRIRPHLSVFVWTVGIGSILAPSLGFARALLADERASRAIKMAGEWLPSTVVEPIRLLDSGGEIAFHAKALLFWLPYCDEKTALDYIEMKKINVVVIRKSSADSYPYLQGWVNNGFPDPHFKLAYDLDVGGTTRERIMIYEIKR
jgi:hypothetical protein